MANTFITHAELTTRFVEAMKRAVAHIEAMSDDEYVEFARRAEEPWLGTAAQNIPRAHILKDRKRDVR